MSYTPPTIPPRTAVAHVRTYYEHNTRIFLAWGRGRQPSTIHRALWADGVTTQAQALHYINDLIRTTIAEHAAQRPLPHVQVLDLGCGVGGTLIHLVQHGPFPMRGLGVSISPTQVRLATQRAAALHLGEHCTFVEADFMHLPCAPRFDFAVAIEALVHAPDPARVLAQAAAALRPGGYLLICDDFLADAPVPNQLHEYADEWIRTFRRGWHANGLMSRSDAVALAQQAGLQLIGERNLTPDLRLAQLPVPLGQPLFQIERRLPHGSAFVDSMAGGLALQYCLRFGIINYCWLVFRKELP